MIRIIKIGGKLIENPDTLRSLCDSLAGNAPGFVLVHGGGSLAKELAVKTGVEVRMHEGRRITDAATLDIAVMCYAGLANKKVVSELQSRGVNACGLSGCDCRAVVSHKRPVGEIDWGFVGDIDSVNAEFLSTLISRGITPVISPVTYSPEDGLLNTNADSVASAVATALAKYGEVEMVFCLDKCGVLEDVDDDSSTIPVIDRAGYARLLAEGRIFSGMLPKLENAFRIIDAGVAKVRLTDPWHLDGGTVITDSGKTL